MSSLETRPRDPHLLEEQTAVEEEVPRLHLDGVPHPRPIEQVNTRVGISFGCGWGSLGGSIFGGSFWVFIVVAYSGCSFRVFIRGFEFPFWLIFWVYVLGIQFGCSFRGIVSGVHSGCSFQVIIPNVDLRSSFLFFTPGLDLRSSFQMFIQDPRPSFQALTSHESRR